VATADSEQNTVSHAPHNDRVFLSRNVVGGIPWAIFTKLLMFYVYLGIPIITVKYLGVAQYGQFTLCRSIGDFALIFASLGLNASIVRFVPELRVRGSKAGLKRLLTKTALLQLAGCVATTILLWLMGPLLQRWFGLTPPSLVLLAAAIVGSQMAKNFVMDTFTALFMVRTSSLLSIAHSAIWFVLLLTVLRWVPRVEVAVLTFIIPMATLALIGIFLLVRQIHRLDWNASIPGIGKRRVLGIAVPTVINAAGSIFMRQYSELFFLSAFFSPALAGVYDIGCQLANMIVFFLPLALQSLLASGFAEAYARDNKCLPRLLDSMYKALIVIVLPIIAGGVAFSPRFVELVYDKEAIAAGSIAAAFFIYNGSFILSLPLSLALTAREKVLHTQPLMVLQVVVNLLLDYLLIPRYGLWGAYWAVAGTWLLTIPIRLYVKAWLLGGIYFPVRYLLKFVLLLTPMTLAFYPCTFRVGLIGFFITGGAYCLVYLFAVRTLGLVHPEDVEDLRRMDFKALNFGLKLLIKQRPAS